MGNIHTDRRRPGLLIVGGAFPPKEYMHYMVDVFPAASVVVGGLPNMAGPAFADERPQAASEAFDEVVGLLLRDRPVVAYGISSGCLVTLGLRAPEIRRQVAQEPFFGTADLWPFIDNARDRLAAYPDYQALEDYLGTVFGITRAAVENRDYMGLLDGLRVPTDVIVGELPLEPRRPVRTWPSFTNAEARRRLHDNPLVTVHDGPTGSGHNVQETEEGEQLVREVLRQALAALESAP